MPFIHTQLGVSNLKIHGLNKDLDHEVSKFSSPDASLRSKLDEVPALTKTSNQYNSLFNMLTHHANM